MELNTYLHFNGNCEEALNFYARALGARIVMMLRYGETPEAGETAPEMQNKIIHGRIALGENLIMASDCPPGYFRELAGFSINIGTKSPGEAEKYFHALSEKAEVRMPLAETFWAHRFGMLVDKFGVSWMVNCEKES
jgi:PhnB protein